MDNKRTQHIVDRAFQVRVASSLTAIAMLVPVVLLIGGYLTWTFAIIHNPDLETMPFGWKLIGSLMKDQWWMVVFFIVVFVAFSFALVFFYTHRIAGPVYRFRWLFDELAEGRIHTRVKLRKGDCFENLASGILRANATLASSITHLKESTAVVSREAEAAQSEVLKKELSAIGHMLDRFTVITPPEPEPVVVSEGSEEAVEPPETDQPQPEEEKPA